MTEHDFRRMALALDGVSEGAHLGHPDFRADGRIFATLRHDRGFAVAVLTPEQQQRLLKTAAGFTPEAGAWGRNGCTRIELAFADEEVVGEALTLARQLAALKAAKRQRGIGGAAATVRTATRAGGARRTADATLHPLPKARKVSR